MGLWVNLQQARTHAMTGAMLGMSCVALAACGSTSGGSTTGSSPSSASLGGPTGGPVTPADVAVANAFVGGKPGKATGSPIAIGLITINGGPIPAGPGADVVDAARLFINDKLNGIDGHPLIFKRCATGISDAQAQSCGQEFLNDPSIKAVLNPGEPEGGLSLLGAMAGRKAEFCVIPTEPELLGTNVFCPGGGVEAASSVIPYLKSRGNVSSVAWLLPDNPLFRQFSSGGYKQMQKAGMKPTLGYVPENSPDVISAVVASGARTASAINLTLVNASQCIAVAKALKSLNIPAGVPIVSLPTCVDPSLKRALGELPHWTYFDMSDSPFLANPDAQAKAYLDADRTYGDGVAGPWSTTTFGTTLWLAKVFNAVGVDHLTTAAIAAQARAFRGPMFLGDPKLQFGRPPWGNTGTLSGRFFTYKGTGHWVDATDGNFIPSPPPAQ